MRRRREYYCKYCHGPIKREFVPPDYTCERCADAEGTFKEETRRLREFLRRYSPQISVKMGKHLRTWITGTQTPRPLGKKGIFAPREIEILGKLGKRVHPSCGIGLWVEWQERRRMLAVAQKLER